MGLIFVPGFIWLGIWQIDRSQQKQQLQDEFYQQQQLPAVNFVEANPSKQYQRINFSGTLDRNRYWLLDNQVEQGRQGYRVIVPFHPSTDTTKSILVDWQWVAAPPRREQLPDVSLPDGIQHFSGFIGGASRNPLLEFSSEPIVGEWPQRIISIDEQLMGFMLGTPLHAGVVKIGQPVLQLNTSADKHRGYAVQWFSMAVVLLIALLIANSNLSEWLRHRTVKQ